MALGWIIFCAMKTLISYIILVRIFYQLLIQTFSFSSNIYLTIESMITTNQFIIMFLPSIVYILKSYFEFINPSWLLSRKRQPRQKLLKIYRKQFYWRKIKTRNSFPTNNQLLEKTNEAARPTTARHPEINRYILSDLVWNLAPKKHWRKTKFDTDSFNIFANSGA